LIKLLLLPPGLAKPAATLGITPRPLLATGVAPPMAINPVSRGRRRRFVSVEKK
jgi:hypothetical protein